MLYRSISVQAMLAWVQEWCYSNTTVLFHMQPKSQQVIPMQITQERKKKTNQQNDVMFHGTSQSLWEKKAFCH